MAFVENQIGKKIKLFLGPLQVLDDGGGVQVQQFSKVLEIP
jgi:hypothetical protein